MIEHEKTHVQRIGSYRRSDRDFRPDFAIIGCVLSGERLRGVGNKANLRPGALDRMFARARRPLDRAWERNALALDSVAALSADVDALLSRRGAAGAAGDAPRRAPAGAGQRVLVASLRGWSAHNAYEAVIAQALRVRGAQVALLTCGGGVPACELGWARAAHPRPCDRCGWLTDRLLAASRLHSYRLGDYLTWGADARRAPAAPAPAAPAPSEPVPAGEPSTDPRSASAVSLSWLLKATQLDGVAGSAQLRDDFAVGVEGVADATDAILAQFEPDVVVLLNGLFAAERTIRERALARGVRAPTYEIAPRAGALVFSQCTPAPEYDVTGIWSAVAERPLSEREQAQVNRLLDDRAHGVGAHESYFARAEEDPDRLRGSLRLEGRERVVSLFTNVTWDSATIGHDIGYGSMFDWVEHAVRTAAGRELVLVVRVHPAEARWGTREQVRDVVVSRLGEVPENIRFVAAHDALSSYALIDISELLLTYTTTVGLEAAARGKRVAVAGRTHYRGRGFTTDVEDPAQLVELLARAAPPLSARATELALRYAHMFFFRAMIPFDLVAVSEGRVTRFPTRAAAIAPGAEPRLDWICDRVLDGQDFGLPERLI
jgi:capsular polysaccharide biosynthesis protein